VHVFSTRTHVWVGDLYTRRALRIPKSKRVSFDSGYSGVGNVKFHTHAHEQYLRPGRQDRMINIYVCRRLSIPGVQEILYAAIRGVWVGIAIVTIGTAETDRKISVNVPDRRAPFDQTLRICGDVAIFNPAIIVTVKLTRFASLGPFNETDRNHYLLRGVHCCRTWRWYVRRHRRIFSTPKRENTEGRVVATSLSSYANVPSRRGLKCFDRKRWCFQRYGIRRL
jgi:hypothetical protein